VYIRSLNNRVKFRTKIPMHCCNINKSRRGDFFFGSPGRFTCVFLLLIFFQKVIEEMNRKAFLIAKEIVESEETFIQVLHLLNEVCCISSLCSA